MRPHSIIRIPILPFGLVNAHLVTGDDGCVLVDAGLPGTEAKVEQVLKQHGYTFQDIRLIVVTHAHVDHAGNLDAGMERFYMGHGGPLVAGEVQRHAQVLLGMKEREAHG